MTFSPEVAAVAHQLTAAGLTVVAPWGPYLGQSVLVVGTVQQDTDDSGITLFHEVCMLDLVEDRWWLHVHMQLPGPGDMNFAHAVATPDEVAALTCQFLLGNPTSIDGWLVPLHRHPEWDTQRLLSAIAHARPITDAAWAQIALASRDRYRELLSISHQAGNGLAAPITWDEWFACIFFRIPPEDAARGESLWLRRDLHRVYRVADATVAPA